MEKQHINTPYRKLRDPKRGKTGKFSASLLGRSQKLQRSISQGTLIHSQGLVKKNVGEYQYLMKNPWIDNNNINWVVQLRHSSQENEKHGVSVQAMVPSVYSKTTQAYKHHIEIKDKKQRMFNAADFAQVLSRNECKIHLEAEQLNFMTNLRSYEYKQVKKIEESEKENQAQAKQSLPKEPFTTIPIKISKKQYPTFLRKDSIKKIKSINQNHLQTAFDGSQNYPAFTENILRQKNYAILKTFTSCIKKPSLPALAWQMGLRNY